MSTGSDWRLLSHDPDTGVQEWFLDQGETYLIKKLVPVESILEANNDAQIENMNRPWGDMGMAARMPMPIWQKLLGEAVAEGDDAYVKKVLNNSDYSKFRTKTGVL